MGLAGVVGTIAASIVLLLVLNLEVRRSEYPTAHHQDPVSRKPATLGEPEGVYQIQQEQGPEWQQRELLQAASEHIMASLEMMDTLLDIAGEEEKWLVRDVFEVVVSNQISNGERLSRFTGEPIDSKDWAEILRNTEEYTERSERLYHQIFALIALYNTDRSLRDAFAVIYGFSPDSNNPVAVREQVERFLQVQD